MEIFGILWLEVIMRPMINSLALLYQLLFFNFGLSIIVFTILIRLAMIPLTIRQTRQMKKMQNMGSMKSLLKMIPGLGSEMKHMDVDEGEIKRMEAVILSMTPRERRQPSVIDASRRRLYVGVSDIATIFGADLPEQAVAF